MGVNNLNAIKERSSQFLELSTKISEISHNSDILVALSEWRAVRFKNQLSHLVAELEGEEDHGLAYSMMRLNNFFSVQVPLVGIYNLLPTQDSIGENQGLLPLVEISKEIDVISNIDEQMILSELLVSLFEYKNQKNQLHAFKKIADNNLGIGSDRVKQSMDNKVGQITEGVLDKCLRAIGLRFI